RRLRPAARSRARGTRAARARRRAPARRSRARAAGARALAGCALPRGGGAARPAAGPGSGRSARAVLDRRRVGGMDLTRPFALVLLGLLPLLWWLAREPRPKRAIDTAHLAQWQKALARLCRHPLRFHRLRFWLLVAAWTATVLAAAGPRVGARDVPRRLALLVDTSASMAAREPGGGSALEAARAALRDALPSLPGGVELCLAAVDA